MPYSQQRLMFWLALALLAQSLATLGSYLLLTANGSPFGGDFTVFWQAGQKLAQGQAALLYDPTVLHRRLDGTLAEGEPVTPFVYPPPMALLLWPLGYLNYTTAVALWSILPALLFYRLLYLVLVYSEKDARQLYPYTAAFCLPFITVNIMSGQTGTLMGVLFLAGVRGWQKGRWWAGLAFGAMIIKPQLGLLLPFILYASRQWRMMATAATAALLLAGLASLSLGMSIWRDYLAMLPLFARFTQEQFHAYGGLVAGPYMSLHMMGMPAFLCTWVQLVVSLFVIIASMHLFRYRQQGSPCLRLGIAGCGALLATPHAMVYDTPLLALAVSALFFAAWRKGWSGGLELGAFAAVLIVPYLQPMAMKTGIAVAWLALLVFFTVLLRRYRMEYQPVA